MKRTSAKYIAMAAFTFLGSYAILFVVLPLSYWRDYRQLPAAKLATDVVIDLLFSVVMLELSFYIDRVLNRRIPWTTRPLKRLLMQTLFQVLGVLSLVVCLATIYLLVFGVQQHPYPYIGLRQITYILIAMMLWALMISTLNTGNFLLKNWKTATLKAAELEVKAARNKQWAAEAELQALKLQIDPHFVFNNLSVLSELIVKDPQLGYDYSESLARVYRYLLSNSKKKLISLREELRFLDAYRFLVSHRMGSGCVFRVDIEASKLDLFIPPVTLQLLIENAIKYNRTEKEAPLVISLYTTGNDELVVSNTLLPLIRVQASTGLGLKNITARYALLGDRVPVIEQTGETFTVKVPLIHECDKEDTDPGR